MATSDAFPLPPTLFRRILSLFLSRSYFTSRACQAEIRAMLQHGVPWMLIHERDRSNGGASLAELMDECPEFLDNTPLRTLLFDDHEPIRWHRILDFQLHALTRIAVALLSSAASPGSLACCRREGIDGVAL